ncbi:hypothetical protein BDM02DRAFT_3098834 [Thelephora ganbajun]|uniref:Uncharacterized protein n=1 Tax=Thelephora ganbajun TaxID=370292 RepID=A0ACB6ZBH6_THEGA|nr:hypothetical protein BDM02DRAFT_3098834 [Thelephora ganbajun]
MPRFALSTFVAVAIASSKVYAQDSSTTTATSSSIVPLASKHFDYNNLPYQADPDTGVRGTQSGFNRCNSTTENQSSLCQTAIINSIEDFCLWAPPTGLTTIGETEHEEVAWCTKPGHGSRLIPAGALKGVQFMKTPDYVQVVGFIDQTFINLKPDDYGGELDPHGADFRGNPLGGLFYSTAWSGGNSNDYKQVIEWHNFMGGSAFCLKACDPAGAHAPDFCQHIYDRIGCAYNAPNNAKNGTFESCQGENQDYPGIYTDSSGKVQTYTQPPESLGVISTMPYQPKVPASSNCVTYTSSAIYAALPTVSGVTPSGHSSGVSSIRSTGTRTGTTGPSNTGTSSGSGSNSGSPTTLAISSLTSLLGVALAVFFLS